LIEPHREKAIGLAFDEARAGDIVLLAGKGHEDYQVLADKTLPWDDRSVAQQELRKRGFDSPGSSEQKARRGVWHLTRKLVGAVRAQGSKRSFSRTETRHLQNDGRRSQRTGEQQTKPGLCP